MLIIPISALLKLNSISLLLIQIYFLLKKKSQKKPNYKPKIRLLDKEKNEYATLESKDYIKYLGILIDKNLTWKHTISAKRLAYLENCVILYPGKFFLKFNI